MSETDRIIGLAAQKLKELHGDDFKFDEGDEVVFELNNATLYIGLENGTLQVKFIGGKPIKLDATCSFYEESEVK